MRNAHILVITIRALANEVAKNLVLAGIGSLTILDPGTVTEVDLGSQFIIGEEHVGMKVYIYSQALCPSIDKACSKLTFEGALESECGRCWTAEIESSREGSCRC